MDKEEDVFYVGVREPVESRRILLECSKDVITSLRRYERFKNIRAEKIERIIELKNIMLELNKLNLELKDRLPRTWLKASSKEEKKSKIEEKSRITYTKKDSELDKLERELSIVEEKLSSLIKEKNI